METTKSLITVELVKESFDTLFKRMTSDSNIDKFAFANGVGVIGAFLTENDYVELGTRLMIDSVKMRAALNRNLNIAYSDIEGSYSVTLIKVWLNLRGMMPLNGVDHALAPGTLKARAIHYPDEFMTSLEMLKSFLGRVSKKYNPFCKLVKQAWHCDSLYADLWVCKVMETITSIIQVASIPTDLSFEQKQTVIKALIAVIREHTPWWAWDLWVEFPDEITEEMLVVKKPSGS